MMEMIQRKLYILQAQGPERTECVYPFTATDADMSVWLRWNPLIGIWRQLGDGTWEWRN